MIITPKRFPALLKAADAVNPYIVMISIAGLILEYTPLKTIAPWMLTVNQVIDVIFVFDFIVRMITMPVGKYFFKGYGWIDLLASIPGIALIFQSSLTFLGVFKVTRIGRFFKIIRLLRFLRVFSFLNRMKGDSTFVQERIMKIGIAIVLTFIVGIAVTEHYTREHLVSTYQEMVRQKYDGLNRDIGMTRMHYGKAVLFYTADGAVFDNDGERVTDRAQVRLYEKMLHDEKHWHISVPLAEGTFTAAGVHLPRTSLVLNNDALMNDHDRIMLILISTLVVMLLIIMLYMGYIFAHDMRYVHLIVDSIDADDYMLLDEEARLLSPDGELAVVEGEDEIKSLVKMTAKLAQKASAGSTFDTLTMTDPSGDAPAAASAGDLSGMSPMEIDSNDAELVTDLNTTTDAALSEIAVEIPAEDDVSSPLEKNDALDTGPASAVTGEMIRSAVAEALRDKAIIGRDGLDKLRHQAALDAVHISTRSIVDYIKRHMKL
ncbi:MAG: ion transporter [Spirochaetes bacterium]|nr:ion transporter [Spirochaetota bacterium]